MEDFVKKLNENCFYKGDLFCVEWNLSTIEEEYTRDYCLQFLCIIDLCNSCTKITEEIENFKIQNTSINNNNNIDQSNNV